MFKYSLGQTVNVPLFDKIVKGTIQARTYTENTRQSAVRYEVRIESINDHVSATETQLNRIN